MLQFGRVYEDAETNPSKGLLEYLQVLLQFGRVYEDAETMIRKYSKLKVKALQFGRVYEDAETRS